MAATVGLVLAATWGPQGQSSPFRSHQCREQMKARPVQTKGRGSKDPKETHRSKPSSVTCPTRGYVSPTSLYNRICLGAEQGEVRKSNRLNTYAKETMSSQKGNSKTAGNEVRMILQPSSHYPEGSRVLRKTRSILGHKEASYIWVYESGCQKWFLVVIEIIDGIHWVTARNKIRIPLKFYFS